MLSENQIIAFNKIVTLDNPLKPARYLWHIKYRSHQSDLRIARQGLLRMDGNAVYACNGLRFFNDMYPWFLDAWEVRHLPIEGIQFASYSYWRIDTRIANTPWFVDPFMAEEYHVCRWNSSCKPRNFICTPNNIPNAALRLYSFDLDRFLQRKPVIQRRQGAVSVVYHDNDFETLVPDKEMNDYIRWLNRDA